MYINNLKVHFCIEKILISKYLTNNLTTFNEFDLPYYVKEYCHLILIEKTVFNSYLQNAESINNPADLKKKLEKDKERLDGLKFLAEQQADELDAKYTSVSTLN